VAHGTLYKALSRLLEAGMLSAVWEDPELAAEARRPRRRLYRVTPAGAAALEAARRPEAAATLRTATGLA
jgi:DNA-binding PadR family transcriptional regulator